MSDTPSTLRRVLRSTLVVVALVALTVPGMVRATDDRALLDAPAAGWTPLVAEGEPTLTTVLPGAGSPAEAAELDALVALQASAGAASLETIESWTGAAAVHRWNGVLLEQIRDGRLNPLRAARVLALLNASIHDAVSATARQTSLARPAAWERDARLRWVGTVEAEAAPAMVAIAGAAEMLLGHLFPAREPDHRAMADEVVLVVRSAGIMTAVETALAREVGRWVGERAIERARMDRSDTVWQGSLPQDPDLWRPLTSAGVPLEVAAGSWRTWVLRDGAEVRPPPPPALGSDAFQRDRAELERLREALTPEQMAFVRFWADGMGTVTPAGHWMLITLEAAGDAGLTLEQTARVAASVSVAQADAFIACWEAKYVYWMARPAQLIPGFVSAIQTPPFPAYPSGHASQSMAAATVLSAFLPAERERLVALARDAAESRVVAGIHWRFDTEAGVVLGETVGGLVLSRWLGAQAEAAQG